MSALHPDIVSNRAVLMVTLTLLAMRVLIAAWLPLFGDEAFYWQESRVLAVSYTDLPPLTAWLIALGTALGGDTLLGVRWPFLLIGAALPLVLRHWAIWRLGNSADANRVALYAMFLPLINMGGVLALPDLPLTLLMLQAFVCLDRAADSNRARDWALLGLCLGAALLTHWRAAALCTTGLAWVILSARGRRCLRSPGLWLALLLALIGLLPVLWFNATHDWSALRFQVLERNPWEFQPSGLWIAVEQIAVLTPLLAVLLLCALSRARKNADRGPFDLMLSAAIGVVALYLLVGLFADNERTRIHWPLPGYLPLFLVLPLLLREWQADPGWRGRVARWTLASTALGALAVFCVMAAASSTRVPYQQAAARVLGAGFIGWPQAASVTQRLLKSHPADSVLIADNFLLGAELDFALGGTRTVYVLDHPRNIKHGRQAQIEIWHRAERHLLASKWQSGLLVIEVHARAPGEWLAAWQSLCHRFATVRWLHEERIGDNGTSFLYADVTPTVAAQSDACQVPVIAHLDFPKPDQMLGVGDALLVSGWAIADSAGVAEVSVWVDDVRIALADIHLLAPHVKKQWPNSNDPDHPNVGFSYTIEPGSLAPGRHLIKIAVRSRSADALVRHFGPVPVWVE